MKSDYFIFDLDDTLVYEIDYLKSAFKEIAISLADKDLLVQMLGWYDDGLDVFQMISDKYNTPKKELLQKYRSHYPTLHLNQGVTDIFNEIKNRGHFLGLITDGRSLTQRNKLKALDIENFFDKIIISEEIGSTKPDKKNYEVFIAEGVGTYFYIGDNVKKDFIVPNLLGWKSICLLDKGENIHKQNFELSTDYLPQFKITSLSELSEFII